MSAEQKAAEIQPEPRIPSLLGNADFDIGQALGIYS
jgi:hypothetical protein